MGNFLGFVLLTLVAILKSTLMPHLQIQGGSPDFMLMMVFSWALLSGHQEAFLWAFYGGLAQDLLSAVPLGTSSLALLIVAFLASSLQTQLYRSNLLIVLVVTLLGTLAFHVVVMLVLMISGYAVNWWFNLVYVTLPTVLMNLLLIIPVFKLMTRLYNRLSSRLETY